MTNRSPLDPENLPRSESDDSGVLGPSDSSDSGSDVVGATETANTDRNGTGERMTAGEDAGSEPSDLGVDRIVGAEQAGLGGGLDQAEEAILETTDEELERAAAGRDRHDDGRDG